VDLWLEAIPTRRERLYLNSFSTVVVAGKAPHYWRLTISDRGEFLIHFLSQPKRGLHIGTQTLWPIYFLESSPLPRVQYGSTSEAGYKRGPLCFDCLSTVQVCLFPRFSDTSLPTYDVENHLVPGTLDYGRSQRSYLRQ
jgi:hypothetical protein